MNKNNLKEKMINIKSFLTNISSITNSATNFSNNMEEKFKLKKKLGKISENIKNNNLTKNTLLFDRKKILIFFIIYLFIKKTLFNKKKTNSKTNSKNNIKNQSSNKTQNFDYNLNNNNNENNENDENDEYIIFQDLKKKIKENNL